MSENPPKIPNTQESNELCVYNDDDFPFIIPRRVIDVLESSENFLELMGLFIFYYNTARKQKTNKIYANTNFTKTKKKIGRDRIRALRKELMQLGLIKEIKSRKTNGKIGSTYYQLLFKWNETSPYEPKPSNPLPKKPPPKKQNKVTEEIKRRYLPIATQLAKIIMDNRNILITPTQMNEWAKQIRLLSRTSEINTNRILAALNWYSIHINDKYTPVIQGGKSLRKKFLQLEDAMARVTYSNSKKNSQSQHEVLTDEYNNLTKVIEV